jgi:HAD superfamily hydrolase (TIGR01509 family)
MIKGVLLDIDGTLLDSNWAHAQAWSDALIEAGREIAPKRIEPLIGTGDSRLLREVAPDLNADEGEGKRIADRRKEIMLETYMARLVPTPGARDLVRRIRDAGLTATIATSSSGSEFQALLKAAGVADLIEHATTKDDARESKPAPDIVEVALQKSGLAPTEAVMIGDTPYDIESASRAGVRCIAVRTGHHSDLDLQDAIAIYDDPADLARHWDTSPLAASGIPMVAD